MVTIPWFIARKDGKHCVTKGTKEAPEGVVACHPTHQQATAHMRALYRNVNENSTTVMGTSDLQVITGPDEEKTGAAASRVRLYFREGERTSDRRVLDPHAINFNRLPPLPIRLQTTQPESGGHAGAEVCGVIDQITRDGLVIVCDGRLDLGSPAGQEASRLITSGILQTWSPDVGDVVKDMEILAEDEDGIPQDFVEHVVEGELLGATIVALPALDSAVIELLDDSGNVIRPAPSRSGPPATDAMTRTDDPVPHETVDEVAESAELPIRHSPVIACSGPANPPASFFSDPHLPDLQRYITITADGRVYGHLAGWGECHIGHTGVCIEPPREDNYSYFHIGQVRTADGTLVATGPIALRGGHAELSATPTQAQSHYDDTDKAVMDVAVGPDPHGIWFSGSLRPDTTEEAVRRIMASGVSGDWREIDGSLRLIGICSVNTPGFPKVRLAASADTPRVTALVAAGGRPQSSPDCGCGSDDLTEQVAALTRVVEEAGVIATAWDHLLSRIAPTDADWDALAARLD